MTKEEREKAIDLLDNLIGMVEDNQDNDYNKALKMGIESLREEPCEDAVSRKEVFETFGELLGAWGKKALMEMPSVTPKGVTVTDFADKCRECGKQKKGKWIGDKNYPICEKCGCDIYEEYIGRSDYAWIEKPMRFCPNCGAEMESENDSN